MSLRRLLELRASGAGFDESLHPRGEGGKFTSSGRAIGEVLKETQKGVLLKHGDKEGWLQKQWTRQEDGKTTFDPKHLDKFQATHVTLDKPEVLKETDKALLLRHNDAEGWIPKSQIERTPDGGVRMPRWCAEKMQTTHSWVEPLSVSETESGKAYKCEVDVARPDGEPQSAIIFLPKSQVVEYQKGVPSKRGTGHGTAEHRMKIPEWLRCEKESEYEAMHTSGGLRSSLLW